MAAQVDRKIVKIFFLDNSYKGLYVTASTTVDEVIQMVAQKLELQDTEFFALYEVNNDNEQLLDGSKRPSDIMRGWYERDPTGKTSKFVMKRRLFFKNKPLTKDPVCQNLLWIQAVYDVINSNYPCTAEEAVKLAGIQVYCSYGDHNPSLHQVGFLTTKIHQFIPRLLLPKHTPEEWEKLILEEHKALCTTTRSAAEAKVQYLVIATKWHFYGCSFFQVEQLDASNNVITPRMYLGVNWEGIMLLKHPNKELVAMYPYTDICSWSSSPNQFSIVVGGAVDQQPDANVTHPFGTQQGKTISDVVQAYIDVLLKELRPEDDEPGDAPDA
eukprot:TRINITY_DN15584_c0_g1_i1.p1 TRINITY_DN15584_c0_g1~~TRINITY_DN15584_c0_g1_i1.p1  ORF type:complete len:338 (+),score=65.91 TRINITY_DN15584_c0_g1_i1:35-1015(+)